jgi:hypothetical protein
MKKIDREDRKSRFYIRLLITLPIIVLAALNPYSTSAQRNSNYTIEKAQQTLRERLLREVGGRDPLVIFNEDTERFIVSRSQSGVRGSGVFNRNFEGRKRNFRYEAIVNIRNGVVERAQYEWLGEWYLGGRGGRGPGRDGDRGYDADRSFGHDGYSDIRPEGRSIFTGGIINQNSGKGLDVVGRSMRDGADVQQYEFANQPNQNWEIIDLGDNSVAILALHSGKALTVQRGRDNNGANIIQRRWNDSPQQRWQISKVDGDWYSICNLDNGKCLDVRARSFDNGAGVQQWDFGNQPNQKWKLVKKR